MFSRAIRTGRLPIKPIVRPTTRLPPIRSLQTSPTRKFPKYTNFGDEEPSHPPPGSGDSGNKTHSPWGPLARFDRNTRWAIVIVVVGGVYIGLHMEQVPETGRWRFMDVSPSTMKQIEQENFRMVIQEVGQKIIPQNTRASLFVTQVASTILEKNKLGVIVDRNAPPTPNSVVPEWQVFVVDEPKIKNAFVIPGRKIFVFSGMLAAVKNADELGAVLSHEIAHSVIGHPLETLSYAKLLSGLDIILTLLLGIDASISRILVALAMQLPHSRLQETEADLVGLRLMSKACLNPGSAVNFWQEMEKSEKGWRLQADFLQTHPGHRTRARAIERWLPEIRERYPCVDTEEFQAALDFHPSMPASQLDPASRAPPVLRPRPRPVRPSQPKPQPRPEPAWGSEGTSGGDWGTSDPWADKNSGEQGSGDWGTSDPWADKNRGGRGSR